MRLIDITNPGSPYEIDHVNVAGMSYGVSISGNDENALVYLAAGNAGLRVFDPHPALNQITSFNTPGQSMQTALDGSQVYIADGAGGLRLVDFTDLLNPQEIAVYDTAGTARDVDIDNGKIYVADSDGGLLIFEITQPPVLPESIFLPLMTHEATPYDCDGQAGVYLYEQIYYRGECMRLIRDTPNFSSLPVGNDQISSIRIIGEFEATLYEHQDFGGSSLTIITDIPDLASFDDEASSVQIR